MICCQLLSVDCRIKKLLCAGLPVLLWAVLLVCGSVCQILAVMCHSQFDIPVSDELSEEISVNHAILMPLVFNLLNDPNSEIVKQALNALDAILEGLDEDVIVHYLPAVMEKLLNLLKSISGEATTPIVAAIGSAAHAANQVYVVGFCYNLVMPHKSKYPYLVSRSLDHTLLQPLSIYKL
jgi:hypothetical protein